MSDLPVPSPYLQRPPDAPWIVGVARFGCGTLPYPLSRRDVERDTAWALTVYGWLGLEPGRTVHLIGDGADEISWWPFENAAMRLRVPWIQAEASRFDANRTDMILRRFRLQAVIGLSAPVLDTLLELGRDLRALLSPLRAIVARPEAVATLHAHGFSPWRLVQIGPVLAFEPPQGGGARYDDSEWRIEAIDGELALTSINARASPFARLRTGVRGRVELVDGAPRVLLDTA